WQVPNRVHTSFGGGLLLDDPALASDPATVVKVPKGWDHATCGTAIHLATIPFWNLTSEILCVAKSDTRSSHGRWLVKSHYRPSVPAEYALLCARAGEGHAV